MTAQANILGYFWQAGFVVKMVMCLLLAASVASWTLIFQRAWFFKQKKGQYATFIKRFWSAQDLSALYTDIHADETRQQGLAGIFHVGFSSYLRMRDQNIPMIEPIQRAMHIGYMKEALVLEQHLPFFASIGSIAPYVGLFGTVWGIMTSFQALGQASQATIAMVAPGISEALIATALGLFTAIPAVIAYNRYTTQAASLLEQSTVFQDEFVALIENQTAATSSKGTI